MLFRSQIVGTTTTAIVYFTEVLGIEKAAEEGGLHLEEAKIKNIDSWSKSEDGAYTFVDATANGNPEIRFVTEGTDTTVKVDGKYTFAPKTIVSFSFDIAMTNSEPVDIGADFAGASYIVQILGSDGNYYGIKVELAEDGSTQTVEITGETVIQKSGVEEQQTVADVANLFSGFIFKCGNVNGSFTISNINVVYAE